MYSLASGLTRGGPDAAVGVYMNPQGVGGNNVLINGGTLAGGTYSTGRHDYGGLGVAGSGDSVTNLSGGVIECVGTKDAGIAFNRFFATVANAGLITGYNGGRGEPSDGLVLRYGGIVINLSGGTITNLAGGTIPANGAAYGIKIIGGAGTIANAGTISGGVTLTAGYANRVIVDPGGPDAREESYSLPGSRASPLCPDVVAICHRFHQQWRSSAIAPCRSTLVISSGTLSEANRSVCERSSGCISGPSLESTIRGIAYEAIHQGAQQY